jgi:uncharacterized membrane protein YkoI
MLLFSSALLISPLAAAKCKEPAELKARAKLSCDDARKAALAKVKGGKVQDSELEEEHGKLVYSFDIRKKGASGVEEVQVDALTGEVVSVEQESAKKEAAEKKAEKK